MSSRFRSAALPAVLLALSFGWQVSAHACAYYSGRATAVNATADTMKSSTRVVVADTGEIDPTGATRDATVVTFDNPPPNEVHSQTLSAVASGADDVSAADASVQKISIKTSRLTITGDLIEANTQARCHNDTMTVNTTGSANIVNLRINGILMAPALQPNTKRSIPGVGTVITNEQTHPDVNTIAVNAIHIVVPSIAGLAGEDIVISHAQSGILRCPCL